MTKSIETSAKNVSNVSTAKTAKTAKAAKVTKPKAKATENVVATENVQPAKIAKVRKTTDEKIVELKNAIERQFAVNQEQITNYTIAKLAKSTKKVNLVEFYEQLIVQLVLTPELIFKF